jgi:hypothetical protein
MFRDGSGDTTPPDWRTFVSGVVSSSAAYSVLVVAVGIVVSSTDDEKNV